MLFTLVEFDEVLNSLIDAILESFQFIKSLIREIFRRWLILLDTLQIADNLFSTRFLLVYYALKIVKFLVHFLGDLVFEPLLVSNALLHFLTFFQIVRTLFLNVF